MQTSGIIQWFLALIPSHPEIQARAHEELDRVVGREHWPTADDEANLPYIRAIIKEVNYFLLFVWCIISCRYCHHRFNASTHLSGWLPHIALPKTSSTTGCSFLRTRSWCSIAILSITTSSAIPIRESSLLPFPSRLNVVSRSFTFNPDRYLGDNLSCAESAKLANVMERDHFTFGAGWVNYLPVRRSSL